MSGAGRASGTEVGLGRDGSNRITKDPHIVGFCVTKAHIYGHVGGWFTMDYFLHTREVPTLRFGRSAAT